MKVEELAELMGKTKEELEEELKNTDVIELKLNDTKSKEIKDRGVIEIME